MVEEGEDVVHNGSLWYFLGQLNLVVQFTVEDVIYHQLEVLKYNEIGGRRDGGHDEGKITTKKRRIRAGATFLLIFF